MPLMRDYKIEVEVTVRIRDTRPDMEIASVTVSDTKKANSYDPDKMINPVTHELIKTLSNRVWDHTLTVEKHEEKNLR